jgi:hypothetical protein
VRRAPAHAGSLSPWERLAFALAFALMAAFVAVVTVSAARAHKHSQRHAAPAASGQPRSAASGRQNSATTPDLELAKALAPVLLDHPSSLAVGVIDRTTGVRAVYNGSYQFRAASIIKTDILAGLLLKYQQSGSSFDAGQLTLADRMIEKSDDDAASELWNDAGGAVGVAGANILLGLRHTILNDGDLRDLTSTTVSDQLKLLTDLTSSRSPLTAASRSYELGLMRRAAADGTWGVPAAATAGTVSAVQNGWLAAPGHWVINSIGVIHYAGQQLLVTVLSDDQPTERAGIAQDEAAAVAAVREITQRS